MRTRTLLQQAHVAVTAVSYGTSTQRCVSAKVKCSLFSMRHSMGIGLYITSRNIQRFSAKCSPGGRLYSTGQVQSRNESIRSTDQELREGSYSSETYLGDQSEKQLAASASCCTEGGVNACLNLDSDILRYTCSSSSSGSHKQNNVYTDSICKESKNRGEEERSSSQKAHSPQRLGRYTTEVMRELEKQRQIEVDKIPFSVRRTGKLRSSSTPNGTYYSVKVCISV